MEKQTKPSPLLNRFFHEYSLQELLVIVFEPWLQTIIGWIPGFLGFIIRSLLYKILLNKLPGMAYIAPGVTFQRSYGISIGKNFAINRGSIVDGKGGVSIGDNVLIGPHVVITSSGHSFEDPNLPILFQLEKRSPVILGNDVWLGANVVILPGVHIGDHVVIGAGAVVSKDIESHSIAVGIPAKVIKKI